ncbi:unnamed protein product [Linum tenue]|uniref:RNase H type-1 domain-containing protein n=1 Tax=Linum tenue TaxID=586396 RepID=A0AAV0RDA6_9ROSI|nr:unnamed protein product [Linum tenue]
MNCLSRLSAYSATIFGRSTSHFIVKGTWNQCSSPIWKHSFELSSVRTGNPKLVFPKFATRCYSSEKPKSKTPRKRKSLEQKETDMEKDSFFVVRKGDVVGVYKTFNECQAQVGSSICDPPVSIYKGESLPDETKEYLATCGLQNAIYTIRAQDLKPDLFGTLVPWPFQQPDHSTEQIDARDDKKRTLDMMIPQPAEAGGTTTLSIADPSKKAVRLDYQMATPLRSLGYDPEFCTLAFDGASRGNPGPAGAGAVLRTSDGTLICRLQEGLGNKTNNVAEYRAVLLGMKYALQRGYRKIRIQGDSKLVCSQVDGTWKVKHAGMAELCDKVKELKDRFVSFEINHVLREFNAEADVQANLAVNLREGAVQEVYE